ncbi:type I-E CRISPR-associated protein Cas5/CasD [Caballeronia sp. LZ029]|uniref:type I-E CRISPR-associated protein Cas5/CasD n=1 Tax=Caballeronia sp. LZ029 TaxID=3038564 RepID=UPI00285F0ABA|nr:type I-E CRISPR-associated protein Cas5/CasD [Caballeronia sp. LZ029]MDR5748102.1 type I-E CRISPR-associated protein Cas5/CasD [Caballeronia sp. LZ029]
MSRHLLMRLRAPLVAFGGETIDSYGVIRDFPALSMVTGLIANALGYGRGDFALHDRLQARIVMGTRLDAGGTRLVDFQTAQLNRRDEAWTTHREPETRQGGEDSYKSPHLRHREYHADLDALVAIRLEPANEQPTLDDVALALDRPKRPLFIGRKPCLPTTRVFIDMINADDVLGALQQAPAPELPDFRFQWPEGEGTLAHSQWRDVCDERNWRTGVHGGWRRVLEGRGQASNSPERSA